MLGSSQRKMLQLINLSLYPRYLSLMGSYICYFNNCFRLKPQSYKDGDAAWDMIHIITKYFDKILKECLAKLPFYGIMVHPDQVFGFADADYATDKDEDRKSVV